MSDKRWSQLVTMSFAHKISFLSERGNLIRSLFDEQFAQLCLFIMREYQKHVEKGRV